MWIVFIPIWQHFPSWFLQEVYRQKPNGLSNHLHFSPAGCPEGSPKLCHRKKKSTARSKFDPPMAPKKVQGNHSGKRWRFIWMFPKIMVSRNHPWINRVFHYKPSILGYPYLWKHPYVHLRHSPFASFCCWLKSHLKTVFGASPKNQMGHLVSDRPGAEAR